ncbi:bcl-2-related ovarian killer protein homolog B-like isoform X2 [Planococcus citri]
MSAEGAVMCSDNPAYGSSPYQGRQRKFSFPASFHSNILQSRTFQDINSGNNLQQFFLNRRRFSNVGDAVTRKLSTTIGWRNTQVPTQEIVRHGKTLCGQYIRCRLKRSGLFTKKCGLQRLRSAASLPEGMIIREVFPELLTIGQELERMHPKLYTGVAKQANGACAGGIIITEKSARKILISVARSLFRPDISWAKIISFFAVAGGLATDCVRQNHIEFIPHIIETFGEIIEDELASWINDNGGWVSLQNYYKPKNPQISIAKTYILCFCFVLFAIFVFVLLLKWCGKLAL